MELTVTLDFACCDCENPVQVTVQCRGEGLQAQPAQQSAPYHPSSLLPSTCAAAPPEIEGTLATIIVPCPTCGQINQVLFEPNLGQVRSVRPYRCFRVMPEPSVN